MADLPRQVTASPSPAVSAGVSHLLLVGGASRAFVDTQRAARALRTNMWISMFGLGVFNRHANGAGALSGALIAFGAILLLHLTGAPVSGLLYACIGFVTCFVAGTLLSVRRP